MITKLWQTLYIIHIILFFHIYENKNWKLKFDEKKVMT